MAERKKRFRGNLLLEIKKRYTMDDFGAMLGVSKSYVSHVVHGCAISKEQQQKFADMLKVPVKKIFPGEWQ